jgi:lysophospholipase L1-like esterase
MWGNVAALAMGVMVSCAIGEGALRPFVTLPLKRTEPEVRYDPHSVRRFTLRPAQSAFTYGSPASIDERGFRRTGTMQRAAGPAVTMLALGDSFTFGMGVRDDEAWPAQVEQRLAALQHPAQVINAGTISYGVFQEMDLLRERGMSVAPAVVIHALYWNDFMNSGPPAATDPSPLTGEGYFVWDRPPDRHDVLHRASSWLLAHSALFFGLRQGLNALSSNAVDGGYSAMYQHFVAAGLSEAEWAPIETFYRDLLQLGRENGFSTLVVVMPVNDLVATGAAAKHPYVVEANRRLAALGLPFVDAFDTFIGRTDAVEAFLPQGPDSHLNAAGYRRLSDAVARRLLEIGRLPSVHTP